MERIKNRTYFEDITHEEFCELYDKHKELRMIADKHWKTAWIHLEPDVEKVREEAFVRREHLYRNYFVDNGRLYEELVRFVYD